MDFLSLDLIRPLDEVEHHFLQVLLDRFRLTRVGRGARLEIAFDAGTPAIWLRRAKHDLRSHMTDFERKVAAYQAALDAFLLRGEGEVYDFHDADFPFRYASGGTLPIVRLDEQRYVCLWYREVAPIGWNIANGGCGSRSDLLDPRRTIERELREELIVADPSHQVWYVFDDPATASPREGDLAGALRLWYERRADLDILRFERRRLSVRWMDAPDSMMVRYAEGEPTTITGCFLNINGEDFGIEIDGIAEIELPAGAMLCDGEITYDRLVNAPVGLFPVDQFLSRLGDESHAFRPEVFFFDGQRFDGTQLDHVIDEQFYPGVAPILRPEDTALFQAATEDHRRYTLCPVTCRIAARYAATIGAAP